MMFVGDNDWLRVSRKKNGELEWIKYLKASGNSQGGSGGANKRGRRSAYSSPPPHYFALRPTQRYSENMAKVDVQQSTEYTGG